MDLEKKLDVLLKLGTLIRRGLKPPKGYNIDADLDELEADYEAYKEKIEKKMPGELNRKSYAELFNCCPTCVGYDSHLWDKPLFPKKEIEEINEEINCKWSLRNYHLYSHINQDNIMTLLLLSRRKWLSDDEWEPVYPESSLPFAELPIELLWEVFTEIISSNFQPTSSDIQCSIC